MKTTPAVVTLSPAQRQTLKKLLSTGTSPAKVQTRARVLLLAATRDGGPAPGQDSGRQRTKEEIAEVLAISSRTVMRVCARFVSGDLAAALYDKPRSGRPAEFTGEAEARVTALACSTPPAGHTAWTLRLIAQRMVELEYVDHISDVTVMRLLKKTGSAPGRSRVGAFPP